MTKGVCKNNRKLILLSIQTKEISQIIKTHINKMFEIILYLSKKSRQKNLKIHIRLVNFQKKEV